MADTNPLPGGTYGSLRRDLGLLDAVGVGFGAIVGAGIFVVLGVAAAVTGPSILLALLLAGIPAAANALSSAQLAATWPQAGGTYEYGYRALTPTAGFAAGWMFLASKSAAAGTVALGLSGYLSIVFPSLPVKGVAVGAILAFTLLNVFGVKRTSRVNLAIVVVSVGSLSLLAAIGLPRFDLARLVPFAPGGVGGVLHAAALLFFAFTGYARIATLGEEVHDPRRTIPRAVVITISGAVLLYLAVAAVAVGSAGVEVVAGSAAPLYAVALLLSGGGGWLPGVVAVGAITAMMGVILSQVLGMSRMAFAMARRDDLPSLFARVNPRTGVPTAAVLLVGGVSAAIAAAGTLEGAASAATFSILLYYGIANAAALRMPPEARLVPPAVPWIGLAGCALLALSLPRGTIVAGLVLLGVGLAGRALFRRGTPGPGRGPGAGTPGATPE